MDQTEAAPDEESMLDLDEPRDEPRDELAGESFAAPDDEPPVEPAEEPAPEYPDPPHTGDAEVDQMIAAVAGSLGGSPAELLAVFEAAHRTLQGRLADVEG